VNPPFRLGDPAKDGEATILHPIPKATLSQQGDDLGMIPAMGMIMMVRVVMVMSMLPMILMGMCVGMMAIVMMVVRCIRAPVTVMPLDQKAPPGDSPAFGPLEPAGRECYPQGSEGFLKNFLRHSEVTQRGHGHVAADAGEGVDVEDFHEDYPGDGRYHPLMSPAETKAS
jgi:hypothetical protein